MIFNGNIYVPLCSQRGTEEKIIQIKKKKKYWYTRTKS